MNPNAQPTRVESFDRSALAFFSNRRIRTRTYGGVGGAEPRGSPLSRSLTHSGHPAPRSRKPIVSAQKHDSFCSRLRSEAAGDMTQKSHTRRVLCDLRKALEHRAG